MTMNDILDKLEKIVTETEAHIEKCESEQKKIKEQGIKPTNPSDEDIMRYDPYYDKVILWSCQQFLHRLEWECKMQMQKQILKGEDPSMIIATYCSKKLDELEKQIKITKSKRKLKLISNEIEKTKQYLSNPEAFFKDYLKTNNNSRESFEWEIENSREHVIKDTLRMPVEMISYNKTLDYLLTPSKNPKGYQNVIDYIRGESKELQEGRWGIDYFLTNSGEDRHFALQRIADLFEVVRDYQATKEYSFSEYMANTTAKNIEEVYADIQEKLDNELPKVR